VTRCTRDLRYAWANPRFGEWLGRSPKELIGQSIREVIGAEAFATLEPYFNRVLAGEHVTATVTFADDCATVAAIDPPLRPAARQHLDIPGAYVSSRCGGLGSTTMHPSKSL